MDTLHEDQIRLLSHLAYFFLGFRKGCRENQNKLLMFNNFFENRAVCEIMRENAVGPSRPQ
jgi:hypothetical protein